MVLRKERSINKNIYQELGNLYGSIDFVIEIIESRLKWLRMKNNWCNQKRSGQLEKGRKNSLGLKIEERLPMEAKVLHGLWFRGKGRFLLDYFTIFHLF